MANAPERPRPTSAAAQRPDDREDWLADLRDWIRLCQHGHEPREAWQRIRQSQATLS
jgi:hypothetical protein